MQVGYFDTLSYTDSFIPEQCMHFFSIDVLARQCNSFLSSTVRAWNNVNDEAKKCYSINTFKCFLNKDKLQVPKTFLCRSQENTSIKQEIKDQLQLT